MPQLSIVIPARNEEWLKNTVEDCLLHSEADTEIIAVFDGAYANPPLVHHPKVNVVYHPKAIGQRAGTNLGVKLSQAEYVMKIDGHVSMGQGFDRILIESAKELGPDVTQIPAQRNLHVWDWVCTRCGKREYQSPEHRCGTCEGEMVREVVWKPRHGTTTRSWYFNTEPKFQYWGEHAKKQKTDIYDVMTSLGACFFMRRDRFWELGGLDEGHGSWGSFGIEIACKSWLSGGRHVCNTKTTFTHLFRTGGIGFPYPINGNEQERARKYSGNLWFNNAWPGQVRPLSWLIDKFAPIPDWHDASGAKVLQRVLDEGLAFVNARAVANRTKTTNTAAMGAAEVLVPVKGVSLGAVRLPLVLETNTARDGHVHTVVNQPKVAWKAASLVTTTMVDHHAVVSSAPAGDGADQPRIHQAVRQDVGATPAQAGFPVALGDPAPSPNPAAGFSIDFDLGEQPNELVSIKMSDGEHAGHSPIIDAPYVNTPRERHKVGVIYYSDNRLSKPIADACIAQLVKASAGMPIVSCTLKPTNLGHNIVLDLERGILTMAQQILTALEAIDTDIVFHCEHDVLYHPSHFTLRPKNATTYTYNEHVWKVDVETGRAITYRCNQLSGLVAHRQLLINHFRARVQKIRAYGYSTRMGFEPGTHKRAERIDDYGHSVVRSTAPNIDLRHRHNLTPSRWSQAQFRNQRFCQGWAEGDGVPGWGLTKGRMPEFLAALSSSVLQGV